MNRLADQGALAAAVLDLKLVRSVLGAIRAADAADARQKHAASSAISAAGNRRHLHPAAAYEPRPHRPFDPVYHARPGFAPRCDCRRFHEIPACDLDPVAPLTASTEKHRIEPPWAVLPFPQPMPPRQPVKIHAPRTDVTAKGEILDIFL